MESFSANIKQELSKINNLKNKELVKAELDGYLLTSSSNKFITENEYNINRFSKLLNNVGEDNYSIEMQGRKFCITIKNQKKFELEKQNLKELFSKELENTDQRDNQELIKAIARGSFLGSGSITNPSNVYHLEIVFENEDSAIFIKEILEKENIKIKLLQRNSKTVLYIKDGEEISNFLAFIGASKSVLDFEDTRVLKDVRNNVNRTVNCETANLKKTVATSVRQIECIKYIKSKNKFEKLSQKQKELANLRLNNPNATLIELGKMLNPELGKSGVNHRLMQIEQFAKELEDEGSKNE